MEIWDNSPHGTVQWRVKFQRHIKVLNFLLYTTRKCADDKTFHLKTCHLPYKHHIFDLILQFCKFCRSFWDSGFWLSDFSVTEKEPLNLKKIFCSRLFHQILERLIHQYHSIVALDYNGWSEGEEANIHELSNISPLCHQTWP